MAGQLDEDHQRGVCLVGSGQSNDHLSHLRCESSRNPTPQLTSTVFASGPLTQSLPLDSTPCCISVEPSWNEPSQRASAIMHLPGVPLTGAREPSAQRPSNHAEQCPQRVASCNLSSTNDHQRLPAYTVSGGRHRSRTHIRQRLPVANDCRCRCLGSGRVGAWCGGVCRRALSRLLRPAASEGVEGWSLPAEYLGSRCSASCVPARLKSASWWLPAWRGVRNAHKGRMRCASLRSIEGARRGVVSPCGVFVGSRDAASTASLALMRSVMAPRRRRLQRPCAPVGSDAERRARSPVALRF